MISYLKYYLERLDQNYRRYNLDDNTKLDIENRKKVIEDLIEKINFQQKSKFEKQAIRVQWMASWKKRSKNVSKKKATLDLFDAINSFIPYMKAINRNGVYDEFEILLNKELDLIDFGYLDYENIHIPEHEFTLACEKFDSLTKGEIIENEVREKLTLLKNAFYKLFV